MPKGDIKILKADPEDGTTPIANLLLEALAAASLSGAEKGAVVYLWRQTYGWAENGKRRKEVELSISDWGQALNTHPNYAARVVRSLVEKKVILRTDLGQGKGYLYATNTRVNQWVQGELISSLSGSKEGTVTKGSPPTKKDSLPSISRDSLPSTSSDSVPCTNKFTPPASSLASPKEILNKYKRKNNNYINIATGEVVELSGTSPQEAGGTWTRVLSDLRSQVSGPNYRAWLEKSVGLGCRQNDFFVGAGSAIIARYLNSMMRALLEKTLIQVSQRRFNLCFLVAEKDTS